MKTTFQLGQKKIGGDAPAYLIAEIAQAHDGSVGYAHAFVDAAADAGADAVKFQTHIASAESTRSEQFRVKFSKQDASRYDYWKRMEFRQGEWEELARHATDRGLEFLSSPFSIEAFAMLRNIGMNGWKVASGEVGNERLMDLICATHKPLLVSTGLSSAREVDSIVDRLRRTGTDFGLLQCTSRYPTPMTEVGLNVLGDFARRYECVVGLSDHSGTPFPALAAIAQGAAVVELHLTLDRRMFGPDVSSSVTVEEFQLVARAREAFHIMDANPVDKDKLSIELAPVRTLFARSLAPIQDLEAGTVLSVDLITAKKPGTGIPVSQINDLIGRRLLRSISSDELFQPTDFK